LTTVNASLTSSVLGQALSEGRAKRYDNDVSTAMSQLDAA